MKVILYMAITLNGYIARENGDSNFISGAAWNAYMKTARKVGNVVMGRRTYETMMKEGYAFPYRGCFNVVMTRKKLKSKRPDVLIFTNKSPKAVLSILEKKGFDFAFLSGGAELATSFMRAGLIDELRLDVVPIGLGNGIKLFNESNFDKRLRLLGTKRFPGSVVQLRYGVIK